jgi:hypothetical protein
MTIKHAKGTAHLPDISYQQIEKKKLLFEELENAEGIYHYE